MPAADVLRAARAAQRGSLIVFLTARVGLGRSSSNAADWFDATIEPLERIEAAFSAGLQERMTRIGAVGADLDAVGSALTAAGWSPARLLAGIIAVVVASRVATFVAARALDARVAWRARRGTRSLLTATSALGAGLTLGHARRRRILSPALLRSQ